MLRGFALVLLYLGSLVAILFVSAGRMDWPMGWASLGVYVVISVVNFFLVDPELVKERSQMRVGVKGQDVVIASISFLFFFPITLLVAGLDAGRFGWSPPIPATVQLVALGVFALGNGVGSWATVTNRFFSTFARVQRDRGHEVVTDGPYGYVRHPGYAGVIVAAIALPFSLASLWAVLPALVGACGFVIRTGAEDRALMEELGGYREYARRVRHRLIPGVW